eukprot:scaffold2540_cov24-Phaeocystis_antarctica.AAC.1
MSAPEKPSVRSASASRSTSSPSGDLRVDELVEAAGTHERRVDEVGHVGRGDAEDALLGADAWLGLGFGLRFG